MGNASRPGTVVVREIDHDPFVVNGEQYVVRELVWNGIDGRSYDLVRRSDDQVLTEDESFDFHPTDAQIAAVLEQHGLDAELETCKMCRKEILVATAHRHDSGWVGTCCWDERLRMTA
ncbi:hypothetical protein ABR737_03440 [Streptomyces sp. Edi2]|uniref:hypothetical protein n=1 Tax=Streptomyces sp. Edi2 TaxID=3162528 RepID=UPI003305CE2B